MSLNGRNRTERKQTQENNAFIPSSLEFEWKTSDECGGDRTHIHTSNFPTFQDQARKTRFPAGRARSGISNAMRFIKLSLLLAHIQESLNKFFP